MKAKEFLTKYKAPIIATVVVIIIVVVALVAKNYLFPACDPNRVFTAFDAEQALKKIAAKYGLELARIIEKMTRWETGHFDSEQYKHCGTGGMWAHSNNGPFYGWPATFFLMHPSYKPCGLWAGYDNGKAVNFVIMPSVEAYMMFLAWYINEKGGNWANWNSNDLTKQAEYRAKVLTVPTPITNNLA